MAIEQLLTALESSGIPTDVFSRAVQHIYARDANLGLVDDIMQLQELTGIKFDAASCRSEVEQGYGELVKNHRFTDLIRLHDITDLPFPKDLILKAHENDLLNNLLGSSFELGRVTGIKPSEEVVERIARKYMTAGNFVQLAALIKHNGISVDESFLQEKYFEFVRTGRWDELRAAETIFGIPLKISETDAQQLYLRDIASLNYPSFETLQKETGISPQVPKEKIQESYCLAAKRGDVHAIIRFTELTGIAPEFSEELLQEAYESFLHNEQYHELKDLREYTRVTPHSEPVQRKYLAYLETATSNDYEIDKIKLVLDSTGVAPSDELMQRTYEKLLEHHTAYRYQIGHLMKMTGIAPCEEKVQAAYEKSLSRGNYWEVSSLQEATGIVPRFNEEVVQKAFRNSIISGRHDDVKKIQDLTGVIPAPPFYQALVKSIMDHEDRMVLLARDRKNHDS